MNALLTIIRRRKYFAPAWVFASLNILTATWVIYIPSIKNRLGLDHMELGNALFSMALGTLAIMPFSSLIIKKMGSGRTTFISMGFLTLIFCLPFLAINFELLCIFLFIVGSAVGITDISMNALVSDMEKKDKVLIMSASHSFFSLGGVIGAGIGSTLMVHFDSPLVHMFTVSAIVLILHLMLSSRYRKLEHQTVKVKGDRPKMKWSLLIPLLTISIIAFISMGNEGSLENWSKLYLQDILLVEDEGRSSLGFVIFSFTMMSGRFFGDLISERFGSVRIIGMGTLLSALGYCLILTPVYWISIIGFGMVGMGFSIIIPELFRLAGNKKGLEPAQGISMVAGFGYVGFLLSPPILGYLAETDSLKLSFTALLITTIIAFVISMGMLLQKAKKKIRLSSLEENR